MNKRLLAFCVVLAAQLAVPGWVVFEQEQTLRHGVEYKFLTEPVDPYDCFRGRYVALRFKAADVKQKETPELPRHTMAYVTVKAGADGFAEVDRVSKAPLKGDNVFQAKVFYPWRPNGPEELSLEFPFNKYFMDEKLAPAAEKAYRKANTRENTKPCWALVRVRRGQAALVNLYIDGQPIRDYLRAHPEPETK